MSSDNAIEEIRALREKSRSEIDRKYKLAGFNRLEDWIEIASSSVVGIVSSTDEDIIISASGSFQPSLGSHWTSLLILGETTGHIWLHEIEGALGLHPSQLTFRKGDLQLSDVQFSGFRDIFNKWKYTDLNTIPDRCYDGAPTTIAIKQRSAGKVHEISCNIANDSKEPTMVLAGLIVELHQHIELKEFIFE